MKKKVKKMSVWLSDTPSLGVLDLYVKKAKEQNIEYIYFDVPVPLEYGLSRTYFYLKVI
jgi:hypothetical protein